MWQNMRNLPNYRYELVGLDSLSDRRVIAASTFIADVLTGTIDMPDLLADINIHVPYVNLFGLEILFICQHLKLIMHIMLRFRQLVDRLMLILMNLILTYRNVYSKNN